MPRRRCRFREAVAENGAGGMRPLPRGWVSDEEQEEELERLERLLSALRVVRGLDAVRETPDEEAGRPATALEKGTTVRWWSSAWYAFRVTPPSKPRRLRPLSELRKRAEAEESDIPENESVRTPCRSYVVDAGGQTAERPTGDPLGGVPPPTLGEHGVEEQEMLGQRRATRTPSLVATPTPPLHAWQPVRLTRRHRFLVWSSAA